MVRPLAVDAGASEPGIGGVKKMRGKCPGCLEGERPEWGLERGWAGAEECGGLASGCCVLCRKVKGHLITLYP